MTNLGKPSNQNLVSEILSLPLSVPYHEHEPATSFLSRIAALHGAVSVQDFAHDINFPYKDLICGEPHTFQHLALLGGCDVDQLIASSIRNLGRNTFRLRDEIATTQTMKRTHIRICPCCILKDTDSTEEIWRAWQRIHWQFVSVRICKLHGCSLITLPINSHANYGYDFAAQLRNHWHIVENTTPTSQAQTEFEVYLINRILGIKSNKYLDQLELNIVSHCCEALGFILTKGASANVGKSPDYEQANYGQLGFEVFQNGPPAVQSTLPCCSKHVTKTISF